MGKRRKKRGEGERGERDNSLASAVQRRDLKLRLGFGSRDNTLGWVEISGGRADIWREGRYPEGG